METTLPMGLTWLDVILLVVLLLLTVRGALRGLINELTGLLAFLGGLWIAGHYYTELAPYLEEYVRDAIWSDILSFVILFCVVLILVNIVSRLLRRFLSFVFTSWVDHLAGGLIGFCKAVILCALAIGLMESFIPQASFLESSQLKPHIMDMSEVLMKNLPLQP